MVLAMAGQGDRRQRLPETLFSFSSLPWKRERGEREREREEREREREREREGVK